MTDIDVGSKTAYTWHMTGPFDFSGTVLLANMNTFAAPVNYTPRDTVTSYPARGVFDSAYQELQIIDGEAITVKMSVLGIRLAEFQTFPEQGDLLTVFPFINSQECKNFTVREVRNDGHGGAKLMLNKVET